MRRSWTTLLAITFIAAGFSCGEDITDCPGKMCVLANGWKLVAVYVDGQLDTSTDLSKYQLTLSMPEPIDATTASFVRISPSGSQDSGTWRLTNSDDILLLIPNASPQESYIISYFSPRELRLIIERDIDKTGPDEYEFVLEPI
jgi:hypothetical protein